MERRVHHHDPRLHAGSGDRLDHRSRLPHDEQTVHDLEVLVPDPALVVHDVPLDAPRSAVATRHMDTTQVDAPGVAPLPQEQAADVAQHDRVAMGAQHGASESPVTLDRVERLPGVRRAIRTLAHPRPSTAAYMPPDESVVQARCQDVGAGDEALLRLDRQEVVVHSARSSAARGRPAPLVRRPVDAWAGSAAVDDCCPSYGVRGAGPAGTVTRAVRRASTAPTKRAPPRRCNSGAVHVSQGPQ